MIQTLAVFGAIAAGIGLTAVADEQLDAILRNDLKPSDFDPVQLRKGTQIEFEHTTNRAAAQRIAMHHLAEHEDYYRELTKMERRLAARKRRRR